MNVHFSSQTNEWATPQSFFDSLNKEFNFSLDPCATLENKKCQKFFTQEDDGLKQSWDNESVFCNPPYGREIGKWVEKASRTQGGGSRDAYSCSNRYSILPRIYIPEEKCRDTLLKRSSKIWRSYYIRTFSFDGSNLQVV